MMAWLLLESLKRLLPAGVSAWRVHLAITGVLMLCMSLPWYTAQIMPDVITPMTLLVLYLLLFVPELGKWKRAFLWACLFFFLIAHNAHVLMLAMLLLAMLLVRLVGRGRIAPRYAWMDMGAEALVLVAGVLFVSWYNGRHGLSAKFSPAANVFFTGRLCENGLLGDYLDEHCGQRDYPLCQYRSELPFVPGDFIWADNNISSRLSRDMCVTDSLLAPMVGNLLTTPNYLGRYLRSRIISTVVQFFQVSANSGLVSFSWESAPQIEIQKRLRGEHSSFITSCQAQGSWDLRVLDRVVHLAFFASLSILIWTFPIWWRAPELRAFILLIMAWVVLNAAVTSSLANVYDRLQSRVVWMVVLTAILALLRTPWGQRLLDGPCFQPSARSASEPGPGAD